MEGALLTRILHPGSEAIDGEKESVLLAPTLELLKAAGISGLFVADSVRAWVGLEVTAYSSLIIEFTFGQKQNE